MKLYKENVKCEGKIINKSHVFTHEYYIYFASTMYYQ